LGFNPHGLVLITDDCFHELGLFKVAPPIKLKYLEKIFDAVDWLAAMTSHIPDHREQMVRYYGYYSNLSQGLRQKEKEDILFL